MKKAKITIGVILFKDTKYLSHSLTSLLDQDYPNIEYIFRDQSPNGEVYDYLKESHPEFFEKATIVKAENLMHSGGHNEMIRKMIHDGGDIYICASNDMLYSKNFVSKMVDSMAKSEAKVATCKLMQWDYKKVLAGDLEGSKSTRIDSYGIALTKSHKLFDLGQGIDESALKPLYKILGPSGALSIFHKEALEAVSYKNSDGQTEYYDELLHYKNDCDLAYRLTWAGFPCLLVEDLKVYHDRQLGDKSGTGALEKLKDHHQKVNWAKESSLLGHLVTVKKNFSTDFSAKVRLLTTASSLVRFVYTLVLAPKMLKIYKKVSKLNDVILLKQKSTARKVSAKHIEQLMY